MTYSEYVNVVAGTCDEEPINVVVLEAAQSGEIIEQTSGLKACDQNASEGLKHTNLIVELSPTRRSLLERDMHQSGVSVRCRFC